MECFSSQFVTSLLHLSLFMKTSFSFISFLLYLQQLNNVNIVWPEIVFTICNSHPTTIDYGCESGLFNMIFYWKWRYFCSYHNAILSYLIERFRANDRANADVHLYFILYSRPLHYALSFASEFTLKSNQKAFFISLAYSTSLKCNQQFFNKSN